MSNVTLRRPEIFRTQVLHVYTYPGVFTDMFLAKFDLQYIQWFVLKEFEKIIAVLCTRMSFFELFLTTAFPGS